MSNEISLDALKGLIRGRPCLVVGTSVTTFIDRADIDADLTRLFQNIIKGRISTNLPEALDALERDNPTLATQYRAEAQRYLSELRPSAAAAAIARGRWSVVVSMSQDMCLEDELRKHFDSQPSGWKVTVVSNGHTITKQSQALFVYKLLGSLRESTEDSVLALSKSDLLVRKPMWPTMLRPLRDVARDGAYLFLGTQGDSEQVRDFVSVLFSGEPPYPATLVFLKGDISASDPVILRLARGRTKIVEVDSDWKDMLRAVQEAAPFQMRLALPAGAGVSGLPAQLESLGHLVSIPPAGQPSYSLGDHRQEILDSLFRPLSVDWTPYQFDLDLRRTQTAAVIQAIEGIIESGDRKVSCVIVRGEAGVGKSVVAKRAAMDLRNKGHLVIWCRRQPAEVVNSYRDLARTLKRAMSSGELKTSPILVCDDPYSLRISVNEVLSPMDADGVPAVILVILRNTDYSLLSSGLRLPIAPSAEIELDFELDEAERDLLPDFLVRIGAASKRTDAIRQVQSVSSANASDILCSFWYLIPETRAVFSGSLEDEYFRLGGGEQLAERWAAEVAERSMLARRAYEFVAVTSGLNIGLPVEILVRALKVGYQEWLTLCAEGKPLWGLLYPDESADSETVVYFTRNEVITRVLLRQLNGGLGHAGEFRALRDLIAACDTATPAYREFLVDVLVKRQRLIADRFSDREGRELFELALVTFPVPDRVLIHHYAKWIIDVGGDPTVGYELLQRALMTAEFPLSSHEERLEFIHTSMAAAVVQRVTKRLQDRDSGLELIKRHLREASTPGFLNLHSVHVQANALLSLMGGNDRVSLESFIEASRSVEKAMQLAGAFTRLRSHGKFLRDLEVMEDLKRRLIESLDSFGELQEQSVRDFERTGDQLYLEAAARKGVLEASVVDKGGDYNKVYQFLKKAANSVAAKKQQLSAGIRRARVDLMVRWRFQHSSGVVDWNEFLGDLLMIQESPGQRDDVLILFYTGVAYFQIGKVTDGLAAFARARSLDQSSVLATQVRAFLRDTEGRPKQMQGVIAGSIGRTYVQVSELRSDVPVKQFAIPAGARIGATVALWIGFSMQGPLAAFRQPIEEDFLLP